MATTETTTDTGFTYTADTCLRRDEAGWLTEGQIHQLAVYASLGDAALDGPLQGHELAIAEHVAASKAESAAIWANYSGGLFADGSRLFTTEGRKLARSERAGLSRRAADLAEDRYSHRAIVAALHAKAAA